MSEIAVRVDELAVLAEEANRGHAGVSQNLRSATECAFTAGRALNQAFSLVPAGQWQQWIDDNFRGSRGTAAVYRRMDVYREELLAQGITSTKLARRFLSEAGLLLEANRDPAANFRPLRVLAREEIAEIQELRKSGLPIMRVAKICGVSYTTVRYHTAGAEAKRRHVMTARLAARKREAARQALRREERVKAARRVSTDLGDFTSRLRILAQDIGLVIERCENKEIRSALERGYHRLRECEDCIDAAVRVPTT